VLQFCFSDPTLLFFSLLLCFSCPWIDLLFLCRAQAKVDSTSRVVCSTRKSIWSFRSYRTERVFWIGSFWIFSLFPLSRSTIYYIVLSWLVGPCDLLTSFLHVFSPLSWFSVCNIRFKAGMPSSWHELSCPHHIMLILYKTQLWHFAMAIYYIFHLLATAHRCFSFYFNSIRMYKGFERGNLLQIRFNLHTNQCAEVVIMFEMRNQPTT
jgi:hypothetical protein